MNKYMNKEHIKMETYTTDKTSYADCVQKLFYHASNNFNMLKPCLNKMPLNAILF